MTRKKFFQTIIFWLNWNRRLRDNFADHACGIVRLSLSYFHTLIASLMVNLLANYETVLQSQWNHHRNPPVGRHIQTSHWFIGPISIKIYSNIIVSIKFIIKSNKVALLTSINIINGSGMSRTKNDSFSSSTNRIHYSAFIIHTRKKKNVVQKNFLTNNKIKFQKFLLVDDNFCQ